MRSRLAVAICLLLISIIRTVGFTQNAAPDTKREFLAFIKARAAELHEADKPPASRDEWQRQRAALRRRLQQAWGPFPTKPCPLAARKLGVLQRDGYRV